MKPGMDLGIKPTRRYYCQFLVSTFTNYTQTYMADHDPGFSHDAINRYLLEDDVSPDAGMESIRHLIRRSWKACLIFNDTVLDKRHSDKIELVRRQYSGSEHGLVKGIGVVNCLYVNLETSEYWITNWRAYYPNDDGKTKLDHLLDLFDAAIARKNLLFGTVLMNSWYATKEVMMHIDQGREGLVLPTQNQPQGGRSRGASAPTGRSPNWTGSAKKDGGASASKSTGSHGIARSTCSGWRPPTARNTSPLTTSPRIPPSP